MIVKLSAIQVWTWIRLIAVATSEVNLFNSHNRGKTMEGGKVISKLLSKRHLKIFGHSFFLSLALFLADKKVRKNESWNFHQKGQFSRQFVCRHPCTIKCVRCDLTVICFLICNDNNSTSSTGNCCCFYDQFFFLQLEIHLFTNLCEAGCCNFLAWSLIPWEVEHTSSTHVQGQ